MDSYADASDLAVRWRPLTDEEADRATVLLGDASQLLRRRLAAKGFDLDAALAAGQLDPLDATIAVVGMVKRAMIAVAEGVSQMSQTVGPFNVSQSFSNPQGNLYLTDSELNDLLPVIAQRSFRSVRMCGL